MVKTYSLSQRLVRVLQTSYREMDWWMLQNMPGLPNTPEKNARLKEPRVVDLWELTWRDHVRKLQEAWADYKASFQVYDKVDLQKGAEELREAAKQFGGDVQSNARSNIKYLEKELDGTQLLQNVHYIRSTAGKNLDFIAQEAKHAGEEVDPEQLRQNVQEALQSVKSQDDVQTTVTKNLSQLRELAESTRDAALSMEKEDVEQLKGDAQSWLADKLVVGQTVLVGFIDGYKEGKQLELTRENPLLVDFVKDTAQQQSDRLHDFIASQRSKKSE